MAAFVLCMMLSIGCVGIDGNPAYAATKVRLNNTSYTLEKGSTVRLKMIGTKAKVTWKSSDKTVATVSSKGKVTAVKKGKANIVAKVSGKRYVCKVTVKASKAEQVWSIVNKERKKQGLSALKLDETLCKAAQERANEIVKLFAHERLDGSSCFTVLDEYKVEYGSAGENIAAGQYSASEVMESWMNSPGHRANILDEGYGKIGIGVVYIPNSTYGYYWVQLFTD